MGVGILMCFLLVGAKPGDWRVESLYPNCSARELSTGTIVLWAWKAEWL